VIIGCYWDADAILHSFSDGWTNMSVNVVNGDGSGTEGVCVMRWVDVEL